MYSNYRISYQLIDNQVRRPKNKISKTGKTFVIIGTSTGGPRALQEVLTRLPARLVLRY